MQPKNSPTPPNPESRKSRQKAEFAARLAAGTMTLDEYNAQIARLTRGGSASDRRRSERKSREYWAKLVAQGKITQAECDRRIDLQARGLPVVPAEWTPVPKN